MGEKEFFSIIVPARNEEKYISRTIKWLKKLDYPAENYEVIIVESGSSDRTFQIAKKFTCKNIKVYHFDKKGVSRARNFGAKKSSGKCKWFVFMDADTLPKNNFLSEINNTVSKDKKYVVGTARILPIEKSWRMDFFFKLYNLQLKIVRASYAMQIIRKNEFLKVRYDESLKVGEDYVILKELKKFGKFFFLETTSVETSTRRFEKQGIVGTWLLWGIGAVLPQAIARRIDYRLIR